MSRLTSNVQYTPLFPVCPQVAFVTPAPFPINNVILREPHFGSGADQRSGYSAPLDGIRSPLEVVTDKKQSGEKKRVEHACGNLQPGTRENKKILRPDSRFGSRLGPFGYAHNHVAHCMRDTLRFYQADAFLNSLLEALA